MSSASNPSALSDGSDLAPVAVERRRRSTAKAARAIAARATTPTTAPEATTTREGFSEVALLLVPSAAPAGGSKPAVSKLAMPLDSRSATGTSEPLVHGLQRRSDAGTILPCKHAEPAATGISGNVIPLDGQ